MNPALFIPALILGLVSSFHCVGMCGAIAFSLPVQGAVTSRKLSAVLLYNAGRITVYAGIGLFFGLLGRSFYIAGWQRGFSITAGIVMLLMAVQYFMPLKRWSVKLFPAYHFYLKKWMISLMKKTRLGHLFLLGMANGLLPCGMVYFAATAAVATGSIVNAVLCMLLFGLGTLPAMFAVSYFGMMVRADLRYTMRKLVPYALVVMAFFMILRGLNLGIPYVSPAMPDKPGLAIGCH